MKGPHLMQGTESFDEIVLYGARGHTLGILAACQEEWQGRVRVRALVDDLSNGFSHPILGLPVISAAERLAQFPDIPVLVTPGKPSLRARLSARLAGEGATFATVAFRNLARVERDLILGSGAHIVPHVRLGPQVSIGAGVQFLGLLAAHDVTIGDFSNIGYNATILGNVAIGTLCNIAPGAILCSGRPGRPLHIGDGATVGVWAVVLRDVPAGATVLGNPAMTVQEWRKLRRLLSRADPAD
jgi:UDP-3-O-[3-hydroxymyristoyl] glucosamine N-acyltransferase